MTKQALQRYVHGPLDRLRQARFATNLPVRDILYKESGYHQWERRSDSEGWKPFDPGIGFGGHEYHCLFKTRILIPESWSDAPVRLRVRTGADDIWNNDNPQFLVFLDGNLVCGLDVRHVEVDLPAKRETMVVLYAYVNARKPDVFLDMDIYRVSPQLEALVYDLSLAYETALTVEEGSEAFLILSDACMRTVRAVDFSSVETIWDETKIACAATVLAEALAVPSATGRMHVAACGHSHIDMAWLWTLAQTREKSIRSYATVLYLMDRYPEYRFSSSQMQLLDFLKRDEPSLFARIKARVLEGRWEVEGAMWVESDAILTSGESLTRQIYWGKRWVKETFGKDQKILWLPDSFGFPATLPQIMAASGLSYFVTTKLGWNETNRMPHDMFAWKGLDGSKVLAYFVSGKDYESLAAYPKKPGNETTYNGILTPSQLLGTWQRFADADRMDTLLYLYGYGDGGGGPTKEMLEYEKRLSGGYPGLPDIHTSTALEFLERSAPSLDSLSQWYGELYLEYHRGTYTTMADIKRLNRACEQAAIQAEFFSSLLWSCDRNVPYPHAEYERAWKQLLLNQFHDILPGSAIAEVYELAERQLEEVLAIFETQATSARKALSDMIAVSHDDVIVFNSLGHCRTGLCLLEDTDCDAVYDMEGHRLVSARNGRNLWFLCHDVPAKGWRRYVLGHDSQESCSSFSWDGTCLDTPFYTVELDSDGTIRRLYDKDAEREVLAEGGRGNILSLTVDYPKEYDAWNIGKQRDMVQRLGGTVSYEVEEDSALRFTLRWKSTWGRSSFSQMMTCYAHDRRIDFRLDCDYQEEHLMLRTEFQVDVEAPRASYDIAYGVCERSTHSNTSWDEAQFEVPAHKWVDLSEETYGAALMSRQSYGYSAKGNRLALSLLRSPSYPNPKADRGSHSFVYALYPHPGRYLDGKVIEHGYELHQALVPVRPDCALMRLSGQGSLVSCDSDDLVIETVKKCEDRDSLILRILQLNGRRTSALLSSCLPIEGAFDCDLLERRLGVLDVRDGCVAISLKPHEIRTVELVVGGMQRSGV
ncbi:MAG: alpha-mannosidase [Sphaerochaetaceae bacterium]|jgi:alpha-mannosidase